MSLTKELVSDALRTIKDSSTERDLIELGAVKKINACDGHVAATIACVDEGDVRDQLRKHAEWIIRERAKEAGAEVKGVMIDFVVPDGTEGQPTVEQPKDIPLKQASSSPTTKEGSTQAGTSALPGVKHIIAVGAGKGGVGKSTVSINLAVGLARQGHAVGLLDGDIYGPSAPTMLGLDSMDVSLHENMLQVFDVHGIKAMTIGKLVDPEKPLIWRGPMAHGAFKQLVEQTSWGELDFLIIDLPPGTGDVPLTMSQMLSLSGAVIVCTPQKVAQDDAVRAARMFQQLNIEVLGIIENMSFFVGDDGKEYDLFGRGGAEQMAQRLGLPFLGSIPITTKLREHSDAGTPVLNFTDAGKALSDSLEKVTARVQDEVALAEMRKTGGMPELTVN